MAERSRLVQEVYDAALRHLGETELELVDVEMVREGSARILRLYIDKPGGVSIDDCTIASQIMDPVIDKELDIHAHDYFEVSSPGLERVLKTDRDLTRYQGEWVEIKLYKALEGRKKFLGFLGPYTDEIVELKLEDESARQFLRTGIARIRRRIKD